jgi:DNA-binding PucR family transcriptional regulator
VSTELYNHPQTVSYRLRRLRELLGDDLDDPGSRLELLLVLVDHLGIEARDGVTGTASA